MIVKFIEAAQGPEGPNWGKFALMRFGPEEWAQRSAVEPAAHSLLQACGWTYDHVWMLDLQTGEGAFFLPGGHAPADLEKHRIWVCPLYEPLMVHLWGMDLSDLSALPDFIEVPDAAFSFSGYRRSGPPEAQA